MPDTPKVSAATDALLAVLEGGHFEYAVVGGLAVVLHGHDRYTQEVDALVWDLDVRLEQFVEIAADHGLRLAEPSAAADALVRRILHLLAEGGTAVDVFLGFLPFEREVIDNASPMALHDDVTALVSSVEDLVIMKLIASRTRDRYDVMALLELYPDLDKNREKRIVTEYAEFLEMPDLLRILSDLIK